jgi:hypothetical protein
MKRESYRGWNERLQKVISCFAVYARRDETETCEHASAVAVDWEYVSS